VRSEQLIRLNIDDQIGYAVNPRTIQCGSFYGIKRSDCLPFLLRLSDSQCPLFLQIPLVDQQKLTEFTASFFRSRPSHRWHERTESPEIEGQLCLSDVHGHEAALRFITGKAPEVEAGFLSLKSLRNRHFSLTAVSLILEIEAP
jgi:hypothetical protein